MRMIRKRKRSEQKLDFFKVFYDKFTPLCWLRIPRTSFCSFSAYTSEATVFLQHSFHCNVLTMLLPIHKCFGPTFDYFPLINFYTIVLHFNPLNVQISLLIFELSNFFGFSFVFKSQPCCLHKKLDYRIVHAFRLLVITIYTVQFH